MNTIQGRVALLTGASRGIGKCFATRLALEGVRLVLVAKNQDSLAKMVGEIRSQGGTAHGIACDLSNLEDLPQLVAQAAEVFGGLDVLINNAGWSVRKPLLETSNEDWLGCFAVNAAAPFVLCREAAPILARSDSAAIINIGSVVGHKGYHSQGAYGASKHALMGLTKVLAMELQPLGIRVHIINPGTVATEMIREMRPDLDPEGMIDPDDIADMLIYLLTHRGKTMIDDVHMRRASGEPWY